MTVTINLWYATSSDRCLHEAALDLLGLGRHLGVDRLLTGELHVELRAEVHGVEFYANGGQRAYIFRLVTTGSSTATDNAGNRGDPRWQAHCDGEAPGHLGERLSHRHQETRESMTRAAC